MSRAYCYHPLLNSGAIRLIKLHPSPNLTDDIQCTMFHTTLQYFESEMIDHYTALSYVWGNAREKMPILIDGLELNVTVNLEAALRYMRDAQRGRLVWADGICINQEDVEEKEIQVSQMGLVYRTAQHTLIFLGDKSSRLLTYLASDKSENWEIKGVDTEDIQEILLRPWFVRVWIFQELILSRDPWIQCGAQRIRWGTLQRVIKSHSKNCDHDFCSIFMDMDEARKQVVARDVEGVLSPEKYVDVLLDTLQKRRGFGVHDPKDMVFAHLGVVQVKSNAVVVDYSCSMAEVYQDLVSLALSLSGMNRYKILAYAEKTQDYRTCDLPLRRADSKLSSLDLPSWCPDWRFRGTRMPLQKYFIDHWATRLWKTTTQCMVGVPSPMLAGIGYEIGALDFVTNEITDQDVPLRDSLPITTPDEQGRRTSRIAFLDKLKSSSVMASAEPYRQKMLELLEFEVNGDAARYHQHKLVKFKGMLYSQNILDQILCSIDTESATYGSFLFDRKLAIVGLKFARQCQARWTTAALVPAASKPGDVICYLEQGQMPLVLRPSSIEGEGGYIQRNVTNNIIDQLSTDPDRLVSRLATAKINYFKFVGECFVDGLMFEAGPRLCEEDELFGWKQIFVLE